ncbi:MAG: hypothetical protein J6S34_00510, partial [Clostridia bacterium]|nr:hypothetical protein [Clostridia bacterium]
MSEKEKSRRARYKKNREKWIFIQSALIVLVSLAVLISAIVSYQLKKTYYIDYDESGNIDYTVQLKENDFYEEDYLESDRSYVASLIDNIITDFYYKLDMDEENVNYRYSYDITARLEIVDDTSGRVIFDPVYPIASEQNKVQSSNSSLVITEIAVIDYEKYNDLAERFLDAASLSKTTGNIIVKFEVDVLSECSAFAGSALEHFTSELRIPLTTETVNVQMTSTVPDSESKMLACTRGVGSEVFKTTAIVLLVLDVLLGCLLATFIYLTRTEDITYAARTKKVLSAYKSYIQKIRNMFDVGSYQVVRVDKFEELLEIRDTVQAPILMYENDDKTCSRFMIPTESKILYLYEIKVEGVDDPMPCTVPSAPTAVVSPKITNVVRPVVKVTVAQTPPPPPPAPEEPAIETVLEEPELDVESEEDAAPEVFVEVENEAEEEPIAEEELIVEEEPIVEV